MKLYIKQRIFSFKDKYDIFDQSGSVVYQVESELFTIAAKLHLLNRQGEEQYYIKKKITLFLAQYEIYKGNILCATVSQEFALFRTKLNIESSYGNFDVQGNFIGMDYEISKNGQYYGSISKKWLSWGDSYELDIIDEENPGFMCALVIAIDNCMHNESNK